MAMAMGRDVLRYPAAMNTFDRSKVSRSWLANAAFPVDTYQDLYVDLHKFFLFLSRRGALCSKTMHNNVVNFLHDFSSCVFRNQCLQGERRPLNPVQRSLLSVTCV